MGDYAFKDGFIYIEDITTDQTETAVSVSTQPISKKSSKQEETKEVKEKGTKFFGKKQLRDVLQKYRQQEIALKLKIGVLSKQQNLKNILANTLVQTKQKKMGILLPNLHLKKEVQYMLLISSWIIYPIL